MPTCVFVQAVCFLGFKAALLLFFTEYGIIVSTNAASVLYLMQWHKWKHDNYKSKARNKRYLSHRAHESVFLILNNDLKAAQRSRFNGMLLLSNP